MSYKLVQIALDADFKLRSAEKFVLVCLAERANENDLISWPSSNDLVNRTGYSRRAVLQIISELEEKRLIEVVRQNGKNNSYFLSGFIHSLDPGSQVSDLPTCDPGSQTSDPGSQSCDPGSHKPELTRNNQKENARTSDQGSRVTVGHMSFKPFTPQPRKQSNPEIAGSGLRSIREILSRGAK
ncbi:helix-turn-helix domain-containing protein [Methylicorpusculum oleiharenae]|uniref:helix-turn-helix transcriptional regulator n=1 Tax=Methylicorpusculum oleiharenae TaxID=1338687 RepID=UPI00135AB409|nr:helix-turn-helix domain-containing protein [Methylicorpusculum oleiharenae]MCD2449321.1 helix-turn-helix domain-containing protein [Methylicorpusculum oleiharenae]